jgi:hypothetical protein
MTNVFPGIGYVNFGKDYNYFKKLTVAATSFGGASVDGYQPDMFITFSTQYVIFINETASSTIEYSFNGTTVHGEITGSASVGPYQKIEMPFRVVSKIWFRIKSGSSGGTVSVQAW